MTCQGLAGAGTVAENRKCGMVAVEGERFCTVHLKAAGYRFCCGGWSPPAGTCGGCGQRIPPVQPRVVKFGRSS